MVSMRSEKPKRGSPRLADVFPTLPLKRFQCSPDSSPLTMAPSRPFKEDRRTLALSTPLSSRRSMMGCLWLYARRWYQGPQHFVRSAETQATRFLSLRHVQGSALRRSWPRWMSKTNSKHWFTTSFLQLWRKVPESDARSVCRTFTHASLSFRDNITTTTTSFPAHIVPQGRGENNQDSINKQRELISARRT